MFHYYLILSCSLILIPALKGFRFTNWFYFFTMLTGLIPCYANSSDKPCKFHINKVEVTYSQISVGKGYVEQFNVTGVQQKNERTVIDAPYTELETITDIDAYYVVKGKKKHIKDFAVRSLMSSSFYNGVKAKTFVFEAADESYAAGYSYTVKNPELMFLSFLELNSATCTDTFKYTLAIPSDLKLNYELVGDTSTLRHFEITNTEVNGMTYWTVIGITREKYVYPENDDVLPGIGLPGVRINIAPGNAAPGDFSYLNSWYRNLLIPQSELNAESIRIIDSWVKGKHGIDLVKTLFDSVKTKISYIAFENGLGAVQPRNVNDVLRNRQGDCKDMSNLLRQSIRHFGIPAYVAISSTLAHPFDLDFPNMYSANHVICIAETENKIYYLDATESFGQFGYPSRQIQGRYVLRVDSLSGQHLKVPIVPRVENRVTGKFWFDKKGDQLEGKFTYELRGLSKIDIETLKGSRGELTYNKVVKDYLSSHFRNIKLDSIRTVTSDSAMIISGYATASNTLTQVDNTMYISQSILMFPHSFQRLINNNERLVFYETMERDFEFHIRIDKKINLRKVPVEQFSENGFLFNYQVDPSENEVVIKYSFSSDSLEVNESNRLSYNKLNDQITKVFNKKLAYE